MSNAMKYTRDLEAARFERNQAEAQVQIDNRFAQVEYQIKESEFRLTTRLGFLMVSTVSIAVAVLTWLIKI